MIKLGKASLWSSRNLPFRRMHHKIIYGSSIGNNFSIGKRSTIIGKDIKIGNDVFIGENVNIIAEKIDIGEGVRIDSNVNIHCNSFKIDICSWIWKGCDVIGL